MRAAAGARRHARRQAAGQTKGEAGTRRPAGKQTGPPSPRLEPAGGGNRAVCVCGGGRGGRAVPSRRIEMETSIFSKSKNNRAIQIDLGGHREEKLLLEELRSP